MGMGEGTVTGAVRSSAHVLFADYFQFYIQDEAATGDLGSAWTPEANDRMAALAPGVVGVGTFRNMDVPVTLEIHQTEPTDDAADWDQVVECALSVPSGQVAIAGCTDYYPDATRLALPAGDYRARLSFLAPAHLSDNGLEGDDLYRVQLWLALPMPPRVLKRRASNQQPAPGVSTPLGT